MTSGNELNVNFGVPLEPSRTPHMGNGSPGMRTPAFDNTTYILIMLVVVIPIIFTVILCLIAYCIYRYNKSRSIRSPTNSPINRSRAPMATVIYNTQHSPFFFEESPPSYDSLANTKKNPNGTITSNEQVQLTILPNPTITHTDEVTSAAALVLPSAPIPPPPVYINLDESNK